MTNQPGNKMNRLITVIALLLATSATPAQDLADSLRKGLFEEQANRDLNAAIEHYQDVIEAADAQRNIIATALYRLAESYRKQGKADQAKELYARLTREFSDQEELISQIPPEFIPSEQITPEADHFAALERLLRNSPDLLNAPSTNNLTFLQHAAVKGNIPMTKFLLERGADPGTQKISSNPPLHLAVQKGHLTLAELLLAAGADVNARDQNGTTALHEAASRGFTELSELLLRYKADVNARVHHEDGRLGDTPLHRAYGQEKVIELLVKHGADINAVDLATGNTPLQLAAKYKATDAALALLKAGANPNVQDSDGITPLVEAIRNNQEKLVEELLARGADPNTKLPTPTSRQVGVTDRVPADRTAIFYAILRGNPELVKTLLVNGADPNVQDVFGVTPLHHASGAAFGDGPVPASPVITKILLESGAKPNPQSGWGYTPLHYAVMRGNLEIAEILLANGAVPGLQDKNGYAPLHYSAGAHFRAHNNISGASLEMTELLLAAKASPNLQTNDGKTPLHFAATPEIAQALIKAGADPNAVAQDSSTPLEYHWNQPAVAEIIKAAGGTNSPQHSMPQPRSRTRNRNSPSETSTPTLPGIPN